MGGGAGLPGVFFQGAVEKQASTVVLSSLRNMYWAGYKVSAWLKRQHSNSHCVHVKSEKGVCVCACGGGVFYLALHALRLPLH